MIRPIPVITLFALLGVAVGQETIERQDPDAAIRSWVRSDHQDQDLLARATAIVLDAGDRGLRALADSVRATSAEQRERRIGVESLVTAVVIEALRRGTESGMRFAGQYDGFRQLLPYSGTYLLSLVLDTPDWFPDDMRPLVVPALRDVYPKGPGPDALRRLREVAEDVDFEAQALREALAFALAQWGQRDLVQGRIDEFVKNAGDGSDTDQLHFVRGLATIHYELREYDKAAKDWKRYCDGMRALEVDVAAIDYYNAACSMSLAGDADAALEAIAACAALVAAGHVDSTAEITREMFENDPDLRGIRKTERFANATSTAFGDAGTKKGERR